MADVLSTGPAISAGPLAGGSPDIKYGPSITFQGDSIPDPRGNILLGNIDIASVKAHFDHSYMLMVDYIPAASAAAPLNIAPAANAVTGVPMVLAGTTAGITKNIPFYDYNSVLQTSGVTLDFGFATVATVAGNTTVTPATGTIQYFQPGLQLVIGNAGNAGGTVPLIATVVSVGATTVVLSAAPANTASLSPVGQGNIINPISIATATAWTPYVLGGVAALFNPLDGLARGVGIQGVAGSSGGVFRVVGYDIYGYPMSENITIGAGAVVAYSRKCFKHIISVTPQFTNAFNYSVGTSDLFGCNLRSDKWEYCNFYVAGTFLSVSTGWTAGDQTTPATPTTQDTRGSVQVGTRGPLGSGAAGGPITGTQRIALFMTLSVLNMIGASPANTVPLYGVAQA